MPNEVAQAVDTGYRETLPPAQLADTIACVWTHGAASGVDTRAQTIVPDNCADIIWRLSPAGDVLDAFVAGPMSRPFVVKGNDLGHFVGIRFRPGKLAGVLRLSAAELRDQNVPVDDVVAGIRPLLDGVAPASLPVRIPSLALALGPQIRAARAIPPAVAHALDLIHADSGVAHVESLARTVGASRQHLARMFDTYVGLRPKFVTRVARLHRAMAIALRSRDVAEARSAHRSPQLSWSAIAAEVGYADQPHLVSDFVSLTALTPSAWLASR